METYHDAHLPGEEFLNSATLLMALADDEPFWLHNSPAPDKAGTQLLFTLLGSGVLQLQPDAGAYPARCFSCSLTARIGLDDSQ